MSTHVSLAITQLYSHTWQRWLEKLLVSWVIMCPAKIATAVEEGRMDIVGITRSPSYS